MSKTNKILLALLPVIILIGFIIWFFSGHSVAVLSPAGQISHKERQLFIIGLILSAVVVIPVYCLTIMIAIKYRATNTKAKYTPEWDHSRWLEAIWWGVPLIIITILSIITWNSSHQLDPYRTIASINPPITIQVVALDWKWLFIYPNQHVASVNQFEVPLNTPINFYLTSDSVMNSFWIPSLGGQIYAMPGMATELHLIASKAGTYYGSSANISGNGFSGMNFKAIASSSSDYNSWLGVALHSKSNLNLANYNKLAKPSEYNPVNYYSGTTDGLFDSIVMKYMEPSGLGVAN